MPGGPAVQHPAQHPGAQAQPPQDARGQDLLSLLQHQHRLRHGGHFPGGPNPPQPSLGSHTAGSHSAGSHAAIPGHAPIGQIPNGQPIASPGSSHFQSYGQPGGNSHQPQAVPGYAGGLPAQANGPVEGLGRYAGTGMPGAQQGPGGVFGQPGGNLAQLFQAAQLQVSYWLPRLPGFRKVVVPSGGSVRCRVAVSARSHAPSGCSLDVVLSLEQNA